MYMYALNITNIQIFLPEYIILKGTSLLVAKGKRSGHIAYVNKLDRQVFNLKTEPVYCRRMVFIFLFYGLIQT